MNNPKQTSRKMRRACYQLVKTEESFRPGKLPTCQINSMISLQDSETNELIRIERSFSPKHELKWKGMWGNQQFQEVQLEDHMEEWIEAEQINDPDEIKKTIIAFQEDSLEEECHQIQNQYYQWLEANEKYPSKSFMHTIRKLGRSFNHFYYQFKNDLKSELGFQCEDYDQLNQQKNAQRFKIELFKTCKDLKVYLENFNPKYLDSFQEIELEKQRKNRERKKKKNKEFKQNSISTADPDRFGDLMLEESTYKEEGNKQIEMYKSIIENLQKMKIEKESRIQYIIDKNWIDKLKQKFQKK